MHVVHVIGTHSARMPFPSYLTILAFTRFVTFETIYLRVFAFSNYLNVRSGSTCPAAAAESCPLGGKLPISLLSQSTELGARTGHFASSVSDLERESSCIMAVPLVPQGGNHVIGLAASGATRHWLCD